jgi:hypothetical protein
MRQNAWTRRSQANANVFEMLEFCHAYCQLSVLKHVRATARRRRRRLGLLCTNKWMGVPDDREAYSPEGRGCLSYSTRNFSSKKVLCVLVGKTEKQQKIQNWNSNSVFFCPRSGNAKAANNILSAPRHELHCTAHSAAAKCPPAICGCVQVSSCSNGSA